MVFSGLVVFGRRGRRPYKGEWFFELSAGFALCPDCSAGVSPASRAFRWSGAVVFSGSVVFGRRGRRPHNGGWFFLVWWVPKGCLYSETKRWGSRRF